MPGEQVEPTGHCTARRRAVHAADAVGDEPIGDAAVDAADVGSHQSAAPIGSTTMRPSISAPGKVLLSLQRRCGIEKINEGSSEGIAALEGHSIVREGSAEPPR